MAAARRPANALQQPRLDVPAEALSAWKDGLRGAWVFFFFWGGRGLHGRTQLIDAAAAGRTPCMQDLYTICRGRAPGFAEFPKALLQAAVGHYFSTRARVCTYLRDAADVTAHAGPDHTGPCDFTSSMAAIVHAGPGWLLFVDGTALLVHVGLTQRDSSPSRPCKPRFACRAVVLLHAGPSSHEFVRSQQLLFKQARLGMYSQEYQGWCGRSGPRGPEFTRNPAIRAALVHAGPGWHVFAVGAALLVHVGAN